MRAHSDGPHLRTKLKTMRDPGVGKCLSRRSGRSIQALYLEQLKRWSLRIARSGELVLQRLIYHHLQSVSS